MEDLSEVLPDGYITRHYIWTRTPGEMRPQAERPKAEKMVRSRAIRAIQSEGTAIYAARLTDGTIKIGCTNDLARRIRSFTGCDLLAFRPGDFDEEREIHAALKAHRARGREYYHAAPPVLDVVNELREHFGLPALTS